MRRSRSIARRARRRLGEAAVRRHRLDELSRNAQDRVQRRHGVLEHHGDLATAHRANSFIVQVREVAALEQDRAADDPRRLVEQAHDRLGTDALAGAGFADDAQRLAGMHVEADAVDRADGTGIRQEPGAQIAHLRSNGSAAVGMRIEPIAKAVAHEVEAHHHRQDGQARERWPPTIAAPARALRRPSNPIPASAAPCPGRGRTARRTPGWRCRGRA